MSASELLAVWRRAVRTPDLGSDAELLARVRTQQDESAFSAIVHRHGRLVWGVCRQHLANDADADDAFQAVFLALHRGIDRIREPAALAAWLHGVAVRVCLRARRSIARRREHESRAAVTEADTPLGDAAWDALLAAVHDEVVKLPESERTAFVLCCLEGVGQEDAAKQLGWKLGTLSGRLCKAKARLLERLTRRGVALSTATAALGVSATTMASVPAELLVKASVWIQPTAVVPIGILELAQGAYVMSRTKLIATLVLFGGLASGYSAMVLSRIDAQTAAPAAGGKEPKPAPPKAAEDRQGGAGGGDLGGSGVGGRVGGATGSPPSSPPGLVGDSEGMSGGMSGAPQNRSGRVVKYRFEAEPGESKPDSSANLRALLVKLGQEGWEYVGPSPAKRGELIFKSIEPVANSRFPLVGGMAPVGGLPGLGAGHPLNSGGTGFPGSTEGTGGGPGIMGGGLAGGGMGAGGMLPGIGGPGMGGPGGGGMSLPTTGGVGKAKSQRMETIRLRSPDAAEKIAATLNRFQERGVFSNELVIVGEPLTNSILIRATNETAWAQHKEVVALIEQIDTSAVEKSVRDREIRERQRQIEEKQNVKP